MTSLIFKVVPADDWREAEAEGAYHGSAKDRQDGFLHFSTARQLAGTLTRHYSGARDLVLAAVDAQALGPALRYEPSRDGALFPHLYGSLSLAAVRWARSIERGANGEFALPETTAES